jgi:hypothetical protein
MSGYTEKGYLIKISQSEEFVERATAEAERMGYTFKRGEPRYRHPGCNYPCDTRTDFRIGFPTEELARECEMYYRGQIGEDFLEPYLADSVFEVVEIEYTVSAVGLI